jgi:signal transduction histidine kinase
VGVCLRYTTGAVEVEIVDDGMGASSNGAGGHGQIGMRERVTLYGGELRVGPVGERGYRVHARLPTG